MRKKLTIEISYYELDRELGLKGKFWHERNASTSTGIKAILEGFYFNGEEIDVSKAKDIILEKLIELNQITNKKSWTVVFEPNHIWSEFDDEDYRHSIYSVDTQVYKIL